MHRTPIRADITKQVIMYFFNRTLLGASSSDLTVLYNVCAKQPSIVTDAVHDMLKMISTIDDCISIMKLMVKVISAIERNITIFPSTLRWSLSRKVVIILKMHPKADIAPITCKATVVPGGFELLSAFSSSNESWRCSPSRQRTFHAESIS